MGIDYYGVLGITKYSDDLRIKEAFRRLAIECNPTRQENLSLNKSFALICEAYDVLSQAKHRAVYDQYGEEGLKKGVFTNSGYISSYTYHDKPLKTYKDFFGTTSPYADLLDYIYKPLPLFEFQEGKGIKKKEPAIFRPLALSLYEVFQGATKKMKIQHRVFVDDTEDSTKVVEKILTIPIKPGLPPGTEISFPESGDQGHMIIPGDIIFITEDLPHPVYYRRGIDLKTVFPVTLLKALTGVKFCLETLDYRTLHIAVTQIITPEYYKVVEKEGMPCVDDPKTRGNLIINFDIKFPIYLPKSSKLMIKKAIDDAKRSGSEGTPDHVQQLVFLDKLQRIMKE